MPCRVFGWLVGETEARAQLVGVDILVHLIKTQAGIHRELIGDFPLVLSIDTHKPADLRGFIADSFRRSIIGAVADGAGLDDREIVHRCLFAADREAGTNRIGGVELVRAVALEAVGVGLAGDVRCNAVQQHVADDIWRELQIVVAGEIGELPIEAVD